jgi:hypothetical protein
MPTLLKKYGAVGCRFGQRMEKGKWTKELGITFLTSSKGSTPRGSLERQRVPKWIEWKDGRARHRLRTDVVQSQALITLQSGTVYGPGDGVSAGPEVASIGAVVIRPNAGRFLTTAGHFLGDGAQNLQVTVNAGGDSVQGVCVESVCKAAMDYALLQLDGQLDLENLFAGQFRIGPVYTPTLADCPADVSVLDRFGNLIGTTCRAVGSTRVSGGVTYSGLIETDAVTVAGQSGCPLIDERNRLWGFLIGRIGNEASVFAPAETIFNFAGVFLAS